MKKVFKTTDVNGNEIELWLIDPSPKVTVESQLIYNKAWREAESKGAILARQIEEIGTRQGLWGEDKKNELIEIEQLIRDSERKLMGGANSFSTLEEARTAAIELRKLRNKRLDMLEWQNDIYSRSAESYADQVRTQFIVAVCTVYPNKAAYFKGYEDFLNRSDEKAVIDALLAYVEKQSEESQSRLEDLYENKFLKKYNYVDDKYRLINKDGHLISMDGKLINDKGQYVDNQDRLVDRDGNLVGDDGMWIVDFKDWEEKDD